ncbi:hypothetical protein CEXT_485261 [Caerostris extrusa]|uniref:Uncharacterized protein n=1 Tax=Caerostris extrusa TaxID=172846 RepID=A0AAV4XU65_CAEEX|nr:hypothetical protein CEXT_485261 [Caerostris extrusa]
MEHLSKPLNIKNKANHCSSRAFGKHVSSIKMRARINEDYVYGFDGSVTCIFRTGFCQHRRRNKPLELNLDHQISEISLCPSSGNYILLVDERVRRRTHQ